MWVVFAVVESPVASQVVDVAKVVATRPYRLAGNTVETLLALFAGAPDHTVVVRVSRMSLLLGFYLEI